MMCKRSAYVCPYTIASQTKGKRSFKSLLWFCYNVNNYTIILEIVIASRIVFLSKCETRNRGRGLKENLLEIAGMQELGKTLQIMFIYV